MSPYVRGLLALGLLCVVTTATGSTQEDLVANPFYTYWKGFLPGTTATHVERTSLSGLEGELVPGGVAEKRIAYKLVEVGTDRAVVEMVVTENDFFGHIQAAPTRHIYPSKINKGNLARILEETGAKTGEEVVKFDGRDLKCKTVSGTSSGAGGEQIEYRVWLSDEVPGAIVKRVRTTRRDGAAVAETITTLESYNKAN